MYGIIWQAVTAVIGIYSYFTDNKIGLVVAGSSIALIILMGLFSGSLKSIGFMVVLAIVGYQLQEPGWYGSVFLLSGMEAIECIIGLFILIKMKQSESEDYHY